MSESSRHGEVPRRRRGSVHRALLAAVLVGGILAITWATEASSAFAITGSQLQALPVTEPFNGSSASVQAFSANWAKVGWAGTATPTGADTTTGWHPVEAYPSVAGAYYNHSVADSGTGIATAATMAEPPANVSRYLSLWLDLTNPGASRDGYNVRLTETASGIYSVELTKWAKGAQVAVLASKTSYSFKKGSSVALVDQGSSVSVWTNLGTEYTQLLTATDSTFSSGYAAIEGAGNITRMTNFKVGSLSKVMTPPDTSLTAGPSGEIGSSSAAFSFTSSPAGAKFECQLDGGAFTACSSPKTYEGIANGSHSFRVRAVNAEGTDQTPAGRVFGVNTLANATYPSNEGTGGRDVSSGGAYNYAPTVMLNGRYQMWWCSGIAGDHILYAESSSVNGIFHARGNPNQPYEDVLQPVPGSGWQGSHVCDPSVVMVHGTYYMFYGGITEGAGHTTEIGAAVSSDGVTWTRLNNGNPIVLPRNPSCGCYGAGQPSAAFVDGKFYLMYTDESGLNGGLQYALRSSDPTFQEGVETATESGFVPLTPENKSSYVVSNSLSPDWQYSDALNAWIVISNQQTGQSFVRFLSKDLSHVLRPDISVPSNWSEGPGLVSTPEKHSVAPLNGNCEEITLDWIQPTPPASPPNDMQLFGTELFTQHPCSQLSGAQVGGIFNGYGIEAGGYPLAVIVGGKRLQFQLTAPALDITNNLIGTTAEVFNDIPYGASMGSGATVIGATGRPPAFVLDGGALWPSSSLKVIEDNSSGITYVTPAEWDSHPVAQSLYEVH